ncbi:MAG: hypothetical protein KJ890_15640 [Gammaproteobacteria bacterium]|nr:hypothetical protein [Gammaproteobacteria bacterium]MBU1803862.1 hypothetical protein [Gammaproteobacteria bacterium]
MNNQPNGGPAFPVPGFEFLDDRDPAKPERMVRIPYAGMTLRDYFAAKAMQGSLADPTVNPTDHKGDFARWCYEVADAMLAARDEK